MLRRDDIHALTASIVFRDKWVAGKEKGCTFPKKCQCKAHIKFRQDAKINNFMLAYGGGVYKFMEQTGYDEKTASAIVKQHKRAIPSVVRWLNNNAKQAVRTGVSYSADPYRRRRLLKENEEWKVANQGKNNPVQAAGANMVKLAMISIPKELPIVFVWHDEIILEVPKTLGKKASAILKDVMEKTADYITGIKGLINVEPRIASNLLKQ
jgi:DNA polymerase I-like protein with 3'-5' exonuclease and polymerase domains